MKVVFNNVPSACVEDHPPTQRLSALACTLRTQLVLQMASYRERHWVSLVPSPTPSFSSLLSTVKRGGPGTFPHVSDVKGRKVLSTVKRGGPGTFPHVSDVKGRKG